MIDDDSEAHDAGSCPSFESAHPGCHLFLFEPLDCPGLGKLDASGPPNFDLPAKMEELFVGEALGASLLTAGLQILIRALLNLPEEISNIANRKCVKRELEQVSIVAFLLITIGGSQH